MSWKATSYIKGLRTTPDGVPLSRTEKLLLMVLADYHNTRTGIAWPSYASLAADALMTRRWAITLMKGLADRGVVAVAPGARTARGDQESNRYWFPEMEEDEGSEARETPPDEFGHRGSEPRETLPLVNGVRHHPDEAMDSPKPRRDPRDLSPQERAERERGTTNAAPAAPHAPSRSDTKSIPPVADWPRPLIEAFEAYDGLRLPPLTKRERDAVDELLAAFTAADVADCWAAIRGSDWGDDWDREHLSFAQLARNMTFVNNYLDGNE